MLTAQNEVASEDQKIHRANHGGRRLKDQPVAGLWILHRIEQQIGFVERFARKENLPKPPWAEKIIVADTS